jgi:hypothetical protein
MKGLNPASERLQKGLRSRRAVEDKKSGLKVVTLIATLNPVSQVLW